MRSVQPGRSRSARNSPAPASKTAARDLGARAERAVVEYLAARGTELIATNLRIGRYELDIVAREGAVVIVVEVRARGAGAWTSGFGSLGPKKRASIRRAAQRLWRDRYRDDPRVDRLRIDAASVTFEDGRAVVEYQKAAF